MLKIVLITPPDRVVEEIETLKALFEEGLHCLHLRKPGWSDDELEEYLNELPVAWLDKISVHGHQELAGKKGVRGIHFSSSVSENHLFNWHGKKSKSVHSIEEMTGQKISFDYFFLSPVFDSISKTGYKSHINLNDLEKWLKMPRVFKVFALGGVDESKIEIVGSMGFDGAALLGAVWQHREKAKRIKAFKNIVQKCRTAPGTY